MQNQFCIAIVIICVALFTFDTVLTDGMVTGHHHLRQIKNVYYALWADVGVLFSADSLWDNWPERVRGVI